MKTIKPTRSQEEMVGFVLIIILVVVISLVFLAISLRKSPEKLASREIESFLQSGMRYSSECYRSPELRYDTKDLIKACYTNEKCLNEKMACFLLNETLSNMLKESLKPGSENPVKGYYLKIYSRETNQTILSLKQGNKTGSLSGSDIGIPVYSEVLKVELEVYN